MPIVTKVFREPTFTISELTRSQYDRILVALKFCGVESHTPYWDLDYRKEAAELGESLLKQRQ